MQENYDPTNVQCLRRPFSVTDDSGHPYDRLKPELILDAVDSTGMRTDAHMLALNSYENRVYQIGIEDKSPVIVKFYRPGRWTDAQILEEHAFTQALADEEVPVIPPIASAAGTTLYTHEGFRFAVYPRQGGRAPALDDLESLYILGRTVARIHCIGALKEFVERPALDVATFGVASRELLLAADLMPPDIREDYAVLSELLIERLNAAFAAVTVMPLRLHGDLHIGNMLWREDAPHFVDFDDARTGPAMQDLWMLLSGPRAMRTRQATEVIEGYREFRDFDLRELALIEPLRTLRLMHHSAWLAQRWDDPAFPRNFPWFNTESYWREHVVQLTEQLRVLDEEPLQLYP